MGNLQINLADKLSWPFACIIGVVLAVPLALRFGKRGRTLGITLSIIAFFSYYLMVSAASAFGRNGALNPFLAAWLPNIIVGVAGVRSALAGRALTPCLARLRRRRGLAAAALLAAYLAGLFPVVGTGCERAGSTAARAAALQHADVRPALSATTAPMVAQASHADSRTAGHSRASQRTAGRQQRHLHAQSDPASVPRADAGRHAAADSVGNAKPAGIVGADLSRARRRNAASDYARRTSDAGADSGTHRRPDALAGLHRGNFRLRGPATALAANRATRSATCTSITPTKRSSANERTSTAFER